MKAYQNANYTFANFFAGFQIRGYLVRDLDNRDCTVLSCSRYNSCIFYTLTLYTVEPHLSKCLGKLAKNS